MTTSTPDIQALIEEAANITDECRDNGLIDRMAAALSALSGTNDQQDEKHTVSRDVSSPAETEVTTAEELEALPFGSVVVDFAGTARTKRRSDSHMGYGWTAGGRHPISSGFLADGRTMKVIHRPEVTK